LFLKPAPSCFDGIQNQGEQGIDCGGPCALACVPRGIQPITLADPVIKLTPNVGHMTLIAHVLNPNTTFASKNFQYSFTLYDDQDNVEATYSGTSFIYAGEAKYILAPNLPVPQASFSRIDFKVQNTQWVPSESFAGHLALTLSGVNPHNASGTGITVDGQISNNDTVTFPSVTIVAVFKGNLGQPAGASQTELENLAPNTSQPFSIIHPNILNVNLPATQVYFYAARP